MNRLLLVVALVLTGCWSLGGNGDDMSCAGKDAGGCNQDGDWEWSDEGCAGGNSLGMFGLIAVGLSRKRNAR